MFRQDVTEGQIGGPDEAGGNLRLPRGIVIIENTLYVANYGEHFVNMYSTDGRYIGKFGGKGQGDGQFYEPRA